MYVESGLTSARCMAGMLVEGSTQTTQCCGITHLVLARGLVVDVGGVRLRVVDIGGVGAGRDSGEPSTLPDGSGESHGGGDESDRDGDLHDDQRIRWLWIRRRAGVD